MRAHTIKNQAAPVRDVKGAEAAGLLIFAGDRTLGLPTRRAGVHGTSLDMNDQTRAGPSAGSGARDQKSGDHESCRSLCWGCIISRRVSTGGNADGKAVAAKMKNAD